MKREQGSSKRRNVPRVSNTVLVIDNKKQTRERLTRLIREEFGEKYQVLTAANGSEAMQKGQKIRMDDLALIAIDLALAIGGNIDPALKLIGDLRGRFPKARILAYTLLISGANKQRVLDAGASSFIHTDDIGKVMTQVCLENELQGLEEVSPQVKKALDTVDVSISIQSTDMEVLWTNEKNSRVVGVTGCVGKKCWRCYHNFRHRSCACAECVAWAALNHALQQLADGKASDAPVAKPMYLPVQGRIARVEVNAVPMWNRAKTEVLAVIEASRFTTDTWEREFPSHKRLEQVVEAARRMTKHKEDARPCASLSIYYRPHDPDAPSGSVYLFCSDRAPGVDLPRKVIRENELHAACKAAMQDHKSRFVRSGPSRFLWSGITARLGIEILIEAVSYDDQPEGLFTEDLKTYWEYVLHNFDDAKEARDRDIAGNAQYAVNKYLADTAEMGRSDMLDEQMLELAVQSVRATLQPYSMHIRTLDREHNTLVKRKGFGLPWALAPDNRMVLAEEGGASLVAQTRIAIRKTVASVDEVRLGVASPLSEGQLGELERISIYVTLPLIFGERVLGTLTVQFDDDSLFSEAKRQFLEGMARALSSSLGRVTWVRERQHITQCSRDLDSKMDELVLPNLNDHQSYELAFSKDPQEQERNILEIVLKSVLELTSAHIVSYYQLDRVRKQLQLTCNTDVSFLPSDTNLPVAIPLGLGTIGRAADTGERQIAKDYRAPELELVRESLKNALEEPLEKNFIQWIGCDVAVPVKVNREVDGVLVAVSPLPGWLTDEDTAILDEFAFKIHQCLGAMRDMRQRLRELETMEALKSTSWAMGLAQGNDVLNRLFLLAITAKQGLKFTRAILFLKKEEGDSVYEARFAVGSATRAAAEKVWDEMPDVPFQKMIDSCLEQPPAEGPDTLQAATVGLEIDLKTEDMIADRLKKGEMLIRRQHQPHIIRNPALMAMLSPQGTGVLEYVLAPLKHGGELHGILLADRAFLKDTRVPADDQAILGVICSEQMLVQEALTRRREAEGVAIAKTITTGLRHSLKSRVAILETRINDLAASLGGGQAAEVEKIRKSIDFLKRASILASRFPAAGILREQAEIALDGLLHEVIQVLGDGRIQLTCDKKATVWGDREKLADAFLEMLTNCRAFIDKADGVVTIHMTEENGEVRIEIRDNGPGIHPSIRDKLFQPFVCYPPEGIGLGLSLASAVFRAHGGKIEERGNSDKERGAFFMVVLPSSRPERRT